MRARLLVAALGAGLLTLGRATPAQAAADSVLVRVGGQLAGRLYETINVPITVDLNGAPGRALGSYRATLHFNPAQLEFEGADHGDFAAPQYNTSHASDSGTVLLTAVQPSGASGAVVLFYARFYVASDSGQSPVTISFDEMSATATSATPFESLVPLLRIVNGTFCRSLGKWGDANGDGDANSLDALVALSTVVGIPVDTTLMNPALTDVDGDGRVTSRDALIILSYAVGLPVQGYRVLLTAPGACGTGSPVAITITPDSLELQVGQTATVTFAALDSLGRSVTTDTGTVTSSDPSVAAWVETEGGELVQARAPGVAIFTARLGPGVAATFKVVVLARRTRWYVDVQRARLAPTQLGNQALPFEFIGEALEFAHDGDTIGVAGGTYEEQIGGNVAVSVLGDPADRPVIDPRGSPYWNPSSDAFDLEPGGGQIVLSDLVVRAGMTFLAAHDVTVHNVRIEGLGTNGYAALEIETAPPTEDAPPARVAGPQRSNLPAEPGNVLVDSVVVLADSTSNGILVPLADTVVIRNSSVTRAHAGTYAYCGAGPYVDGGIVVQQASVSSVHDNVVANPECQGIGAFDPGYQMVVGDVGRVTISRNGVTGAPGTGIAAGARLVSLDHNAVRNTGVPSQLTYGATVAVHVIQNGAAPDSVTSRADTVVNSNGGGLAIDTAAAAVLDSLVVSGTGLDSSGYAPGVYLNAGGRYWLSHSQIANTAYSPGVLFAGDRTVLYSHGNRIVGAGDDGLTDYQSCDCAPPARPSGSAPASAPGPRRVGPYTGGPDTLVSVADTVVGAWGNGILALYGAYALVDSAVVDSVGNDGVRLQYVSRGTVSHSLVRLAYNGIYASYVDTLWVLGDSAAANAIGLNVYNYSSPDSTRIAGSTFAGNSSYGLYLYYANARVDSSVAVNNGTGLYIDYGSGARVRWTRFQTNNVGMWMSSYASSSSVVNSNFLADTVAGARNDADGPVLAADTNYWGDARGPRCTFGCDPLSVGDSIFGSVTFGDSLPGPAPTPAPPPRFASIRTGPARGPQVARAAAAVPVRPVAARSATQVRAASARGAQGQRPTAWHAPSRAKTHAVQIVVRKRT